MPGPLGSAHRMTAPYQAFRCSDGYITIGAANDRTFAKLAGLMGHPEWTSDPRFATNTCACDTATELAALIEAVTSTATRAEWLSGWRQPGIPCGPILDYAEAFAEPQAIAREMTVTVDHPTLGPLRTLGTPIKMSDAPLNPARRAPMLGEHTDEVLNTLGFSDHEIDQLRSAGAVR